MSKGKFESAQAGGGRERGRRDLPLLLLMVLVLAAVVGVLAFTVIQGQDSEAPEGMTRDECLEAYRRVATLLEQGEMTLTLIPEDPSFPEDPILLTLTPAQSRVCVDLAGLEADLKEGVGKVGWGRYLPDPAAYISLDRAALRRLAQQTQETWAQDYVASFVTLDERMDGDRKAQELRFNIGRRGREIDAEAIYQTLVAAYLAGDLNPTLTYVAHDPAELEADTICDAFCTAPVDAVLDQTTFAITPDVPGYGFEREELEAMLAQAEPGRGYVLPLRTLEAAVTAADVEAALYADVLGEAHTPHNWVNDDRTVNLILACQAIDGTVVMPGGVFSFNDVVGERTAEKGYRPAGVYVGSNTVQEIGGGICQVASSIYYAMLQADLLAVERHAHTYLVTYVPQGMDAAIYWGRLDFKFENTSPYPIRIDATVSEGSVHIYLRGTEWKDYTVQLSSRTLEEIPWEVQEKVVTDGSYKDGQTIVSPYTGYRIETYKSLYDLEGNLIEKVKLTYSAYNKRDKVVAVVPATPTEPPSEP